MGKRASAVAVLLATSFLGSLLALVLVGRNPLVGPTTDLARTESLAEEVEASPVTVPGASPLPSQAPVLDVPESAVLSAADARPPAPSETGPAAGDPPGPDEGAEDEAVEPTPPPDPEPAPADDASVVAKGSASGDEPAKAKGGTGPAEGKVKGGGDGSKGPKGNPKEDAGSPGKGPKGGPKEDAGGAGKGPKSVKDKGPGNAGVESPGKGNGKP